MHELLQNVPRDVIEAYVQDRINNFAFVFAQELVPNISQQQLDIAFSRAVYFISAQEASGGQTQVELRFSHDCRYLGCLNPDCSLCKNNPNKTCAPDEIFDEAYVENRVLKAKCEADISVELVNKQTGEVFAMPGVEVQLSVIDGDEYNSGAADPTATIVELRTSDEGEPLLKCAGGSRALEPGTVLINMQNGRAKLPDVVVAGKNETFKFNGGNSTSHFRLMALVMRRDELGRPVPVEPVAAAVSNSFAVKTQRAYNDYHKPAYPHYKDGLTRLRHIGATSADRLMRDPKAWLGKDIPLDCVDNVEVFKKVLEYAETHRHVENKLLELLNMRGKHKHKWDYLRNVLTDKVVYDDNTIRVWCAPDGSGYGLLYHAKQAQVVLDRPAGVVQRVVWPDGVGRVQVMPLTDISRHPQLLEWRRQAEASWRQQGHPGWQVLQEPIDWVNHFTLPAAVQHPAKAVAVIASPRTSGESGASQLPYAAPPLAAGDTTASIPNGNAYANGNFSGDKEYPEVPRQQLEMQHDLQQQQVPGGNLYPPICPGHLHTMQQGFAPQTVAAQQLDPMVLRSQSDPNTLRTHAAAVTALRSHSTPAGSPPGAPSSSSAAAINPQTAVEMDIPHLPPVLEESGASAFMLQHPGDAVDMANAAVAVAGGGGGQDAAACAERSKRGRGGDVVVLADPQGNRVLVTTASHGRHHPAARSADNASAARTPGIGELESITFEDLPNIPWPVGRADHTNARDDPRQPTEMDLGAGLELTNTLSSVLRLGDSLMPLNSEQAPVPKGFRALRKSDSDSFKRIIDHIGVGADASGQLAGIDSLGLLEQPSIGAAVAAGPVDAAAGTSNTANAPAADADAAAH